jgi:hypothetical protein
MTIMAIMKIMAAIIIMANDNGQVMTIMKMKQRQLIIIIMIIIMKIMAKY